MDEVSVGVDKHPHPLGRRKTLGLLSGLLFFQAAQDR